MNLIENNVPEYTVSEFNKIFNETVSTAFSFVKIRGEISNLKKHYSGHIYFNLKDENSIINSVCWRDNVHKLNLDPEEGIEVIATGKISTYAKSISVYQINIENIEIAGEGALLKLIEDRKKRLEKSGFFDINKKISLPFIPKNIGIITSPTGSVIKDIIHRIKERFPIPIQIWPVAVQGKNSPKEIIRAIEGFNENSYPEKPDVIIIARGGGSVEDLMPFNDEDLAKSVFHSKIPNISEIGHETDTTIIDYASDFRAPTPSAAAEKCVPVRKELKKYLENLTNRLEYLNKIFLNNNRERFKKLERLLQEPSNVIIFFHSKLDNLINRTNHSLKNKINLNYNNLIRLNSNLKKPNEEFIKYNLLLKNLTHKINYSLFQNIRNYNNYIKSLSRLLKTSSIEKTLRRGYSIIKKNKKIISKAEDLKEKDLIDIQFYKSNILAKIKKN